MTTITSVFYVEAILAIPLVLLGVSHIAQPKLWIDFFARLAAMGTSGVVIRTFMLELWPAILIVIFHQDWTFPGLLLTLYGHALLLKVSLSMLWPDTGLRSLKLADKTGRGSWIIAGLILLGLGAICAWRVSERVGLPFA